MKGILGLGRHNVSVVLGGFFSVALGGCATFSPPVPEGYQGPVAIIKDSVKPYSWKSGAVVVSEFDGKRIEDDRPRTFKADFFYVSEVDGKRIEDSRLRTRKVNQGRGMDMTPAVIERNVPAQQATFTLVARTEYAAPILALTNTVYQVTGKVTFNPQANRSYVVRGELGENYSAVWLEDEATGKAIGQKIEVNGPSKLTTFEK